MAFETDDEVHVVPIGDTREHVCSKDCWCEPEEDDEEPDIWLHNAADGRLAFETGERLPS